MLDIVIVKNANLSFFRELFSMNRQDTKVEDQEEMIHFQTASLTIETSAIKKIDMDGEIECTTPAEIMVLNRHLTMIQGA
ncbi:hypothetical protein [Oceanobacillus massiliensis]|uniref:hypothetical protein n=1 Tax=Oceanobacillus massiliensis TaxID=1465765 RepID=UPI003016F5F6